MKNAMQDRCLPRMREACSVSKMVWCSTVRAGRDGSKTSRTARALHRSGSAQGVSRMRLTGVQNVSVDPQMTQMIKTKKDFSVPC